jgi:S-layer protein
MPYSASQLTTFYTNANIGTTPSAAESLLISAYATQNANGALTDAQTLANVLALSQDKTDVALATYEFFTGTSPTLAGLAYLVNGGGNPNDLSSSYYASFNKENRYYNFSINLAFGGPSAASFASTYSGMTFNQAVQAAYELIVGSVNATAAGIDPAKAIASIESSFSYFQSLAAERAPQANQDLATKAIMIGYILEEAQKADVGTYAKSIDGFMTSLATTGTATAGTDLLNAYPATATQSFALTTGVDNLVGTTGNDTVTGTLGGANPTLTALDKVNGGAGTDTLVINDLVGSTALPNGLQVSGVENVTAQSAAALTMDFSAGFTGLQNVTATGATSADVTVGDGTAANVTSLNGDATVTATDSAVTVTSSANATVTGGSSQTVTNAGSVTLAGATGAINVTDSAQGANAINVDDGSSVTVTTTSSNTGAINIGTGGASGGSPTGAVTLTDNVAAKNANLSGGNIAVKGGTVDLITVNATEDAKGTTAGHTVTLGSVTVTGTTSTTAVTVNQTAAATAAAAASAIAGVTETGTAVFSALTAGQTLTLGGLTFTAGAAGTTAAQTAAAFANLYSGASAGLSQLGTYSGTFTGWTTGAAGGSSSNTVVFTSTTPNTSVTDLAATGTGTHPTITEVQGVGNANTTETGAVTFQALAAGQSVTVGGLTYTSAAGDTAANVAAAFASLPNNAAPGGAFSGTLTGWSSGAAAGSTVTFTSSTPNANVTDLATSTTGPALTVVETQGNTLAAAAVSGVAGIVDGAVTVTDAKYGTATANTISSVSLASYASATISSNALTTLSLANANDKAVTVNNNTATSLNLSVNGVTDKAGTHSSTLNLDGGTAGTYTTLSIASGASDSALAVTASGVQTLTVAGSSSVDMTNSTLSALKNVTVTGAAGLTLNASGATVKDVNASGTSGAMAVTVDASKATYEGGSGVDAVTLSATTVSKAISLGDGNDTLVFAAGTSAPTSTVDGGAGVNTVSLAQGDAATLSGNSSFATQVVNFQHLTLSGAGGGTVDLSTLGHYGYVTTTGDDSGLILNNMVENGTVVVSAASNGGTLTVNIPNATVVTNTSDVLNVALSRAGAVAGGSVTAAGVETINISANDVTAKPVPVPGATADSLTIVDTALTSVTVSGNTHLTLTTTGDTSITSVDASGMTGGLTYTTAGTVAETVHGGAASNALTAGAGATADVLIGGTSADVLTANAGLDVLTGGGGHDTFVVQTASSSIGVYSTITDFVAGDQLKLAVVGTETFQSTKISLAGTAVFQDYANAAIAATGDAHLNGAVAWFQYNGDTYVVENLHNGTTTPSFVNGTDIVVKLTGLVDLSHAGFNSAGILSI